MLRRPDLRRALRRRRPPVAAFAGAWAAGAAAVDAAAAGASPPRRTTRPLGFIPSLRSVLRIVFAETLRWLLRWRRPPIVGPTTGAEFPADPFSEPAFAYASILFYIYLQRNSLSRAGLAWLDREFLGGGGCLCTQVITPRLQTLLPSVNMHRRNLGICGLGKE